MEKLKYILWCLIAFTVEYSYCQSNYNIGTSAVPFLRISTDAQASGMGSTGIATSPDVNSVYWNSGKLAFSEAKKAISANYSPWLKEWGSGMFISSLAGYFKISEEEAIYGLLKYFNPGDIQFTDNGGNHLQAYHPNEFAIQFGYARKLSDRFGVSAGLKYIRSDLARGVQNGTSFEPGNAIAIDAGFYYDLKKEDGNGWSFGAALSNMGSKISYTSNTDNKAFIPANLGLGACYTKILDEQNKLIIALDINRLLVPVAPASDDSSAFLAYGNKTVAGSWLSSFTDSPGGFGEELKEFQVSTGVEYWYNDMFALRAGYFYENKNSGGRTYFSTGAGIRYDVFTANFSYLAPAANANKNPITNTLIFGLMININDQKGK